MDGHLETHTRKERRETVKGCKLNMRTESERVEHWWWWFSKISPTAHCSVLLFFAADRLREKVLLREGVEKNDSNESTRMDDRLSQNHKHPSHRPLSGANRHHIYLHQRTSSSKVKVATLVQQQRGWTRKRE